jgi:transformation/transcription domain-associated protein
MVVLKRAALARQAAQAQAANKAGESSSQMQGVTPDISTPASLRQPYEHIEEIVNILKSAFPLLALTMETFVDQIHTRFKATPDEDTYRFTSILVNEAITVSS